MRRLVFLVYALVFVTQLNEAAIVPLLPTFRRELSLSELETGAVLAAATFVTVLVALPVGRFADRLGPHRLSVAAAVLVAAGAVLEGLAGTFWVLIVGRILFGAAFATVWTAGISLVSSAVHGRRAAAIGGTIAVAGVAGLVGPTASGFLAGRVSFALPFLLVAAAAACVAALLARERAPRAGDGEREAFREALHAVRTQRELGSALVVMALLGLVAGVVPLLVPLILDERGLSSGEIGIVFSAAALVWILASAGVARLGGRVVRVPLAGLGALALGAVLLVPVATLATAGIAAFLLLRAATHAPLSTISYPLAETGARIAGIGSGTALGLANLVWGAAAAVAPVVAGAVAGAIGPRSAFALVALACGAAGAWILSGRYRAGRAGVGEEPA